MTSLLEHAEALEKEAAAGRVSYLKSSGVNGGFILDVGCGNGYAVMAWIQEGRRALGVDSSLYRFSRWIAEHPAPRPFVVASAVALPFRTGVFDDSVSSGLIEHIGVAEAPNPYRVSALPGKFEDRKRAVEELLRVTRPAGAVTLDFPNGWFPVDFWHGDRVGAFRLHPIPDALNPSLLELRSYARKENVTVLPMGDRLRFQQVRTRWWGRLLAAPVAVLLRTLDSLPRSLAAPLMAVLSPFLVVRIKPGMSRPR